MYLVSACSMCKHVQHLLRLPFALKNLFICFILNNVRVHTQKKQQFIFLRYISLAHSCNAFQKHRFIYAFFSFKKDFWSTNGSFFHTYHTHMPACKTDGMRYEKENFSSHCTITSHSSFQSVTQTNLDFQREKRKPFNHLYLYWSCVVYSLTHCF